MFDAFGSVLLQKRAGMMLSKHDCVQKLVADFDKLKVN